MRNPRPRDNILISKITGILQKKKKKHNNKWFIGVEVKQWCDPS